MMRQANAENPTLRDFEDALVEEEVDLLAEPEEQQKQIDAIRNAPPAGQEFLNLINNFRDKRAKRAEKAADEAQPDSKAQEEIENLQRQIDELKRQPPGDDASEQSDPSAIGRHDAPTDLGPFRHARPEAPDVDGDGIPDHQDPQPSGP